MRLWAAAGILALAACAWFAGWRGRSGAPKGGTPALVLVLPPQVRGEEGAWLGPALRDFAEQCLMGDAAVALVHGPTVDRAVKEAGAPSDLPEALAARFGARWVVGIQAEAENGVLRLQLRAWDRWRGGREVRAALEGAVGAPEPLQRDLHRKLRGALGLDLKRGMPDPRLCRLLEAWRAYGRALPGLNTGDPQLLEASLSDLSRSVDLDPRFSPAQAMLALAFSERYIQLSWLRPGEAQPAVFQSFQAAARRAHELDPDHVLVRLALARLHWMRRELKEAIATAEGILREDPNQIDAELVLADSYAVQPEAAAQVRAKLRLERAVSLGDDRFYPRFRLTVVYLQNGSLEKALDLSDQLAAAWPDRLMPYVLASNILLWLERPAEAKARLDAGLQRFPTAKLLHRNLAYWAFETGNRAVLDRELAFAARAWTPRQSTAILLRGLAPALRHDLAATEACYEPYLRRAQAMGEHGDGTEDRSGGSLDLYFMARTLALLGHPQKGRPYLEAADHLVPNRSKMARGDPAFQ